MIIIKTVPQQIGRTERITNSVNPQFSRSFELEYFFEQIQQMRFRVYDLDNDTSKVSDDDFLGQIECTLGEVRTIHYRAHCRFLQKRSVSIY